MKLTEKSSQVFNYVRENGGKVSIPELCEVLNRTSRSVGANVNDLVNKGLVKREKETIEGQEKPAVYVVLTDEGKTFEPTED